MEYTRAGARGVNFCDEGIVVATLGGLDCINGGKITRQRVPSYVRIPRGIDSNPKTVISVTAAQLLTPA